MERDRLKWKPRKQDFHFDVQHVSEPVTKSQVKQNSNEKQNKANARTTSPSTAFLLTATTNAATEKKSF